MRLSFHDCVGGCDGCVDLGNPDNNGLLLPIEVLSEIAENEEISPWLSRADVFALSALVAANEAQPNNNNFLDFPMTYFGRVDCIGEATGGPVRDLPGPDLDTDGILDFFDEEFGFNARQTTALLGAHTLGQVARENSGFRGQWVRNNEVLDNAYYDDIVGQPNDLINAPGWNQERINNNNLPGIPDRFQWVRGNNNNDIVMLNVDIALVRDFSDDIDSSGEVSCRFGNNNNNNNRCPVTGRTSETIEFAGDFRASNALWLEDFRDVMGEMTVHGYSAPRCPSPPCKLLSLAHIVPSISPVAAASGTPSIMPSFFPEDFSSIPSNNPSRSDFKNEHTSTPSISFSDAPSGKLTGSPSNKFSNVPSGRNTHTPSIKPIVLPTSVAPTMSLGDTMIMIQEIKLKSKLKSKGKKVSHSIDIKICDENKLPIGGVLVSLGWESTKKGIGVKNGTTKSSNGNVIIKLPKFATTDTIIVSMVSMTKFGYQYNAEKNAKHDKCPVFSSKCPILEMTQP